MAQRRGSLAEIDLNLLGPDAGLLQTPDQGTPETENNSPTERQTAYT